MAKRSLQEWLTSGRHLPKFFRDFHAQKDVFKWIWRVVMKHEADPGNGIQSYLKGMTWTASQVYVVDYFLWIMAKHGYTLQRTKKTGNMDFDFYDWDESIQQMKDEEAEQIKKWVEELEAASRKAPSDG